jgi:hypothetical protein
VLIANDFALPAAPTNVRYVSTFQTAPAATASMDAYAPVFSADASLEGSRIGGWVVLFGKDGAIPGGFSYTLGAAPSAMHHLIVDLVPNASYTIAVAGGSGAQTLNASAQGVLEFTTTPPTAASQILTITKN